MSSRLFECVPNYSEGRRQEVIERILAPFTSRRGLALLDHRADRDHNRLVVTLVGEEGPLQEALLESARAAIACIDLRVHRGAHPRIGAVDVIPFVPLRGVGMEDAVSLARSFAATYARETRVPVYLYEEAALRPGRRALEDIRRGQFETLVREVSLPERAPDFGPQELHPSAGATVIGARQFLIAFNINLRSGDMALARRIARRIRASSGGLPCVKAVGVALSERGMVQVSVNLTDYRVTPPDAVLELVRCEAAASGVSVAETELYGVVPAAALIQQAARSLQVAGFQESQVLDLRLLDLQAADSQGRGAQCP
jgi:glutamate formiminotransferase / 5-formyltetrahydrofolate cyclo-ligase